MSILTISDVHIKKVDDEPYKLFMNFLNIANEDSVEAVFLLGDIFDLMVGEYEEYINDFPELFLSLKKLSNKKKIYFLEGNHDFHLRNIFEEYLNPLNFEYHAEGKIIDYHGKRILFCHGDDIELGNPSYKIYKYFIRSRFIRLLAKMCFRHKTVKLIGDNASKKSRQRNTKRYTAEVDKMVREKFRASALGAAEEFQVKGVVAGHSHTLDLFREGSFIYLNNGFFPKTGCYGKITPNNWEIVSLL